MRDYFNLTIELHLAKWFLFLEMYRKFGTFILEHVSEIMADAIY